jgi:hypothetical protein
MRDKPLADAVAQLVAACRTNDQTGTYHATEQIEAITPIMTLLRGKRVGPNPPTKP